MGREPDKAAGIVMDVIRLDLLEAVRPGLLVRFLRPHEPFLRSRGVLLDDVAPNERWIAELHRVLNAVDAGMPAELQQALIDVADLTTESAHEQVLAVARDQQLGLFTVNARTTPEDLAFEVYLDHRDLFRCAHARARSGEAKRFIEFVGKNGSPPEGHLSGGKQALLARVIGRWFRERNRTAFCDVRVVEAGDEVRFLVIHGRPPRTHGAIESDERRGRVSYVPDKHDVLIFDRRSARLSIHAQFAREHDFYRRALGKAFWGDEDHFGASTLYTGEPLLDMGAAALAPHGVPGVHRAVLRELTVACDAEPDETLTWRGPDIGPVLETPLGRLVRMYGVVLAFRLDIAVTGRRHPVRVDVRPPNHISFDRRVAARVVREYLIEAGFVRVAGAGERGEAA